MAAKSVGFAVAEEDLPLLDELVEHFGGGNRSEFLREAMRRMRRDAWAERMQALQAGVHEELGGRYLSDDEIEATIRQVLAEHG